MPNSSTPQPEFAQTVSADARAVMEPLIAAKPAGDTMMALLRNPFSRPIVRAASTLHLRPITKARLERFGVKVTKSRVSGVPVKLIQRTDCEFQKDGSLLLNFHGGGFLLDSGSLTESIPIASMTNIPVVSVMYRMAPKHPFPAAVDDALAVYRDALSSRSSQKIGLFGTSAGAVLTLQLLARIKSEGLPMPAAAGIFSGSADLANPGDCEGYLPGLMGSQSAPDVLSDYIGKTPRTDPALSPIFGDMSGFPPSMLMTSTRDQLLSQTVIAAHALRRAGAVVDLRIYEGMLHAFWAWIECPESDDALEAQASFFLDRLAESRAS